MIDSEKCVFFIVVGFEEIIDWWRKMVKNDKRQQTGNESSVLERGAVVGGHECLEVSEALVDEEAAEEQSGEEEVD